MNEWCIEHHGKSGLTEKVRQSQLSVADCESQILDFLKDLTPPGVCPLAGNSVGEDKRFLTKYMPNLMKHLHFTNSAEILLSKTFFISRFAN